jgi:hypothetical protein
MIVLLQSGLTAEVLVAVAESASLKKLFDFT